MTSLEAASRPNTVATLFSTSRAEVSNLIKDVRWLDDENVAFLWDDGSCATHLVSLNVRTHQMRPLIRHATAIVQYAMDRDGQTVVITAQAPRDRSKSLVMHRQGFTVVDQSIWSLLQGDFDGWTSRQHYETFVWTRSSGVLRKVVEPIREWITQPELLSVCPEGGYAIAVRPAGEPPASWDAYTEHFFKDIYLPPARQHPNSANLIRQYYLIDLKRASARPLWDAPESPFGKIVWSPTGRSVIIGPTFLPAAQADATGLAGRAVVELDVATGHFLKIPIPNNQPQYGYRPINWSKDDTIELGDAANWKEDKTKLWLRKIDGVWQSVLEKGDDGRRLPPPVRIELHQDPNTPPALYAVEMESRHERLIRDLNPQLRKDVTLGRVELVHWKSLDGRRWTGMLYYPVQYEPGRRYPLVIQTHGYSTHDFSLDGSFTTVFAAQPLANLGITVLQVGGPDNAVADAEATPREPQVYIAGYEGAIEEFAGAGLVDRKKVGIIGFSRTGWHVEYMLTHSKVPLAAAEVADNIDVGYFESVLSENAARAEFEADNGARQFGKGLETWLRVAPGFNADKIQTPLRMEQDTGPVGFVLLHWEMFSNLRYLRKPVELFMIPDIEHGVHILQNPAQRLASQGGTVDWFRFWLKGEEDPDPAKAAQYACWRELRKLHEENERKSAAIEKPQ